MDRITIEPEGDWYAAIVAGHSNRYWVEKLGAYWCLKTDNGFNDPVTKWRESKHRATLADILPLALTVILRREHGPVY